MRILFVGNSYTFYNDLPSLFARLAVANGKEVSVDSVIRGGWYLHKYLDVQNEQADLLRKFREENHYDFCVLQEQSLTPAVNFEVFRDGAERITEFLRPAVDRFVLYATWGRKEGHPALEKHCFTPVTMMEALEAAYCRVGRSLGADVAPVGRNFATARTLDPQLELYDQDLTHPSYVGSCIAAMTIYKTIFRETPMFLDCLALPAQTVALLEEVVANQAELCYTDAG